MTSLGSVILILWFLRPVTPGIPSRDGHNQQESASFPAVTPARATAWNNEGELLRREGRLAEAAVLLDRSIAAWERLLGSDHPNLAVPLNNRALVDLAQGRLASAEKRLRRALEIRRRALGDAHPLAAATLANLGVVLEIQGRPTEAARCRALASSLR
jgi:tetratricopeptide (TPR) repeat protein